MNKHKHHWKIVDPYDAFYHSCKKCKRQIEGDLPGANDCPVSDEEHNAAAWLGSAGLYRTRLEAVQNGEQRIEPVSADQLFVYARCLVLMQITEGRRDA